MTVLKKLEKLEHEVADFGFAWENTEQIMQQISSECVEIQAHLFEKKDRTALQEEIGDLLHAVFSLCVFCNFDPQETLEKTVNKFEKRFKSVQAISAEKGLENLKGLSFQELMDLWSQAKVRVG